MKPYELTYLISPELTQKKARDFHQSLISFIQDQGGILDSNQGPTTTELSYLIKEKSKAYLATIDFHLKTEKLPSINQKVKSKPEVLRHLLVAKKTEKAPVKRPAAQRRKGKKKKEKVELKEIDKKLKEILGE